MINITVKKGVSRRRGCQEGEKITPRELGIASAEKHRLATTLGVSALMSSEAALWSSYSEIPLTPALSPMGRGSKFPLPARERVRVRGGCFCSLQMAGCAMEDSQ